MKSKILGLVFGFAVGDAIGLSREAISPKKAKRIFKNSELQHSMILLPKHRIGLFSDDTEHLYLTALSLARSNNQPIEIFSKHLRHYLKLWFLSLPSSGGGATYKAWIRLLLGFRQHSGIYSAGNGVLMRAPIIAVYFYQEPEKMKNYLLCSSKMTHTDERAIEGAYVMGLAISLALTHNTNHAPTEEFFQVVLPLIKGKELKERLSLAQTMLKENIPLIEYANKLNLKTKGVTGYINDTLPIVLYTWLSYFGHYQEGITHIVNLGGDTDTSAALVGSLIGASTGTEGIPKPWKNDIRDYPISLEKLKDITHILMQEKQGYHHIAIPWFPYFQLLIRNIFFFVLIIIHAIFRAILPFRFW